MAIWRIRYQDRYGRVHSVYEEFHEEPSATQTMHAVEEQIAGAPLGRSNMQSAIIPAIKIVDVVQVDAPI
jgi:hypothetical protein